MDIYFMRWIDGHDRRLIGTIVMIASILGILGIIVNLNMTIGHEYATVGRILAILLAIIFIWLRNPNKGMYTTSEPKKLFFSKVSLIASAAALFGIISLTTLWFSLPWLTTGRVLAGSLAISIWWFYAK